LDISGRINRAETAHAAIPELKEMNFMTK